MDFFRSARVCGLSLMVLGLAGFSEADAPFVVHCDMTWRVVITNSANDSRGTRRDAYDFQQEFRVNPAARTLRLLYGYDQHQGRRTEARAMVLPEQIREWNEAQIVWCSDTTHGCESYQWNNGNTPVTSRVGLSVLDLRNGRYSRQTVGRSETRMEGRFVVFNIEDEMAGPCRRVE